MSTKEPPDSTGGRPPVALIAGPTASGKSDLAVQLALRLQDRGRRAVIINADSAQVYADLAVLSARPSPAETQGVDHRLFGTWDGAKPCSAADWATAAKAEIVTAHAEGTVPILCGGTGLYIRSLLAGIAPIPAIDAEVRETVRALDQMAAYAALVEEDPRRAQQLNPGDRQRTARALEIIRSTKRSMLDWQDSVAGGIEEEVALYPLILLPERDWLYERCDRRFELMLESGAVAEVEALLARGLDPTLPVMRAIGVPEIAGWLRGETSRDDMIAAGQQATRNYAKRQFTWFRRQPPDNWPREASQNISWDDHFELLLRN